MSVWYADEYYYKEMWFKVQSGRVIRDYFPVSTDTYDRGCKEAGECPIFCRAVVDKFTPHARKNMNGDLKHIIKYHYNALTDFPCYTRSSILTLKQFNEEVVPPNIYPTKGERLRAEHLKIDRRKMVCTTHCNYYPTSTKTCVMPNFTIINLPTSRFPI